MGGDKIVVSGQKFITTYVPSNSQPFPIQKYKDILNLIYHLGRTFVPSWNASFRISELWTWLTRFDPKERFGFSGDV